MSPSILVAACAMPLFKDGTKWRVEQSECELFFAFPARDVFSLLLCAQSCGYEEKLVGRS
jgi:hypothetical protein